PDYQSGAGWLAPGSGGCMNMTAAPYIGVDYDPMRSPIPYSTAMLSSCDRYRYFLARPRESMFGSANPAVFVMLNPSTADANADDPTIRRCRGFAKAWECAGLLVINLY